MFELQSGLSAFLRGFRAIAIATAIAIVIILIFLWLAWWNKPTRPAPVYQPVPTVTAAPDYYSFLENPEDYYAGRCAIASQDAAPDWYAAHPGLGRCQFKKVANQQ
jgi:hypothetical protein